MLQDEDGQSSHHHADYECLESTPRSGTWCSCVVPSDAPTLPEPEFTPLLRAGFTADAQSHALLRAALVAPQPRARVLALRGATRQQLLDTGDWQRALADTDVDVRREALTLLATLEVLDAALVTPVRALLHDEDALVVDGAVFALGEHLCGAGVEELMVVAASHDDARCRESAIAALGALGDDRSRAVIIGALDDKPPVRRRAIVALANFEGPDIDAALERAGDDRDWQVRAAVSQLGRDDESER